MQYVYVVKDKKGMIIRNIDSDETYVREDNSAEPKVEYYGVKFKSEFVNKYFATWEITGHNIITIPENSIQYNYSIDLQ